MGFLCALLLTTLWIYRPYASSHLISGNDDRDALTYHTVVADTLVQLRHGVFPAYVGQSEFRWNGGLYPQAQAPGLGLLASGVYVASAGRLGSVGTLNTVVLLCALGGALAMYVTLRRLDGGRPWLSAAGALLYVSCPGVLGTLVRLDMLTTLLALPLLPLVWHALLGLRAGGSPRDAVALGLALAALWTCHAPIALWTTCLALLWGLGARYAGGARTRDLLLALAVFLLADAWHLTSVFSLGADDVRDAGTRAGPLAALPERLVTMTLANIRADLPGALLPVGWVPGGRVNGWPVASHEALFLPESWRTRAGTPYLQLGYGLWSALAVGLWAACRGPGRRLRALIALATVLCVFLFPWPWLNAFAWSHLPAAFGMTRVWPMQRFYLVLATLAAPAGVLALRSARARYVVPALVLVLFWSGYEAQKFSALALSMRAVPHDVELAENASLKRKDIQMGARRLLPEFSDPALAFRLVSDEGRVLVDPRALLTQRCASSAWSQVEVTGASLPLRLLTLVPHARQAVCFRAPSGSQVFAADARGYLRIAVAPDDGAGEGLLPLWSSLPDARAVTLQLTPRLASSTEQTTAAFTVVPYDAGTLPIRLTSLVPLEAHASADAPGRWLETPRLFVPGYRASVNGEPARTRSSVDGYVQVALKSGTNAVRLEYLGTPAMRVTFWLSALAWLLGLLAVTNALSPFLGDAGFRLTGL